MTDRNFVLSDLYVRLLGWRHITQWSLEKDGRRILGWCIGFEDVAEYCFSDEKGFVLAAFNGNIICRTPDFWKPVPRPPFYWKGLSG